MRTAKGGADPSNDSWGQPGGGVDSFSDTRAEPDTEGGADPYTDPPLEPEGGADPSTNVQRESGTED